MKYLLLILNSKLGKYLMRDSPQTGTGDLLISVQAIEPLLIPIPDDETIETFENIFDSIFKNIKNEESTSVIEERLDLTIYKLFNFSSEEIEFIEIQ